MADSERTPTIRRHGSVHLTCPICGTPFRIGPVVAAKRAVHCCSEPCRSENARRTALERQFWGYVNKTETCWLWTGYITKLGVKGGDHGIVCIHYRKVRAHRFSYELHVGPIPEGLSVLHHCDVPRCVNPAHLYVGTQKDNIRDAVQRHRHVPPKNVKLADRTHCANGHPTEEWLATSRGGHVYCRRCKQISNARRYGH